MRLPTIIFHRDWAGTCLGHVTGSLQRVLGIGACAAAATLAFGQISDWRGKQQAIASERQALVVQKVRWVQAVPKVRPSPPPLKAFDIARHNAAVGALNAPWSDIFDGLERGSRGDVGLTLLEPDTKKGTLRLQVEGKRMASLLSYAQGISSDPVFGQLTLHQHETNEQDPNRPARLSFELPLPALVDGGPK